MANGYTEDFAEHCFNQIEGLASTAFLKSRRQLRPPGLCLFHG